MCPLQLRSFCIPFIAQNSHSLYMSSTLHVMFFKHIHLKQILFFCWHSPFFLIKGLIKMYFLFLVLIILIEQYMVLSVRPMHRLLNALSMKNRKLTKRKCLLKSNRSLKSNTKSGAFSQRRTNGLYCLVGSFTLSLRNWKRTSDEIYQMYFSLEKMKI